MVAIVFLRVGFFNACRRKKSYITLAAVVVVAGRSTAFLLPQSSVLWVLMWLNGGWQMHLPAGELAIAKVHGGSQWQS